jgi:hypothetical protein
MLAIAVCGFAQQYVSPRRRGRIIQYRFAVATNAPRKDDYRLVPFSMIVAPACRAKYVSCIVRIKMYPGETSKPPVRGTGFSRRKVGRCHPLCTADYDPQHCV